MSKTGKALTLPKELEALISQWYAHSEQGFWSRWGQCQVVATVSKTFGRESLVKFSESINVPVSTLYAMRQVYECEPIRKWVESHEPRAGNPFGFLTVTHLQVAMRQKGQDPVKLLQQAEDGEWTIHALEKSVKARKTVVRVVICEGHAKEVWQGLADMVNKEWILPPKKDRTQRHGKAS